MNKGNLQLLRLLGGAALFCQLAAAELRAETNAPLFAHHDKIFYRLPSLMVTSNGTVLAACQKRFGSISDFAPSSLVLRRSRDGGRTFEAEQTLFEHAGDCVFNGNLVEDRQSGTLFATFIAFPQAERATWFQDKWMPNGGGFSVVKSTDDGRTWSAPLDIMPAPNAEGWHGGGAFNNNHGIQLQRGPHAGRLVIGARVFKSGVYEKRDKGGLIYSDDHGATWRVGGVMLKGAGGINGEVTVGETPEGEVYVNSRNEAGKSSKGEAAAGIVPHQRIFSRSRDGGETFYAEGCHAELYDGPCNAGLTSCGKLMLFTAPAVRNRSQLTLYLSRNAGHSWSVGQVVSEQSGGYSDIVALSDRTVLVLHESPRGLLLERMAAPAEAVEAQASAGRQGAGAKGIK